MADIGLSALDRELKTGAAALLPLARQCQTWDQFVEAVRLGTRGEHA